MQYRKLGRTGWQVSEIGLGTWAWGGMWGPQNDTDALAAYRRALDLGVNFIDTAYVYGDGHSEQLVGTLIRSRKNLYVATKIPPKNMEWPATARTRLRQAFPAPWIRQCTERSLRLLGVECIDLQQFHVWTDCWTRETEWLDAMSRLKHEGKIRAFGVSINDHEPRSALTLVGSGYIDTVQVVYNVFDQQPAEALFPLCQEHDVGVIVRVPFDEGSLTGQFSVRTKFHKDDWRRHYFAGDRLRETVERLARFTPMLVRGDVKTVAQGALQFCLSHPAVSTVIPGMRQVRHVEENVAVSTGQTYTPAERAALAQHAWPRNFYAGIW